MVISIEVSVADLGKVIEEIKRAKETSDMN